MSEFSDKINLDHAKEHLDRLKDNIRYDFIDYTEITEEIFRKGYRKYKTKEWIIDVMWKEYKEFIEKFSER